MSPTLTLEQEILLGAALDNLSSAAAADRLARASRVLSSIQSGSCVVLPAPGSFGRSTPAVRRACESARLARTASRPPRTKPKAAGAAPRQTIGQLRETALPVGRQPLGATPKLPTRAHAAGPGPTPGDWHDALGGIVVAPPPARPALPTGAECRAQAAYARAAIVAREAYAPQAIARGLRGDAAHAWVIKQVADLLADPAMLAGLGGGQ